MAFAEHDGARIHWSALGQGEPLVLVMGLGCSSAMWFRLAPLLAGKRRVILLDNRGVGQTQAPQDRLVHRVASMAGDIGAVLDAAGEPSAHVLGLSMGGMIAQQFALDFPARVRSLMLAATHCGGAHAIQPDAGIWRLLFKKATTTPEQALRAMQPYTYARTTKTNVIEQDNLVRLAHYPETRGYLAQLHGLLGWSSHHRLPSLRCPTLVLHGVEDQLIPPANGRLLVSRIPGSRLVEIENASHWLHSDQPGKVADAVTDFIGKNQGTAS